MSKLIWTAVYDLSNILKKSSLPHFRLHSHPSDCISIQEYTKFDVAERDDKARQNKLQYEADNKITLPYSS